MAWALRVIAYSMLASIGATQLTLRPAHADQPRSPAVWYRSADDCPDGNAFIALLQRRSLAGQLAEVGDRIDFVVTVGVTAEGARGRLEQQTAQGTVALREVTGPTCEGVADALALTLALTWDPNTLGVTPQTATQRADAPTAAAGSPKAASTLPPARVERPSRPVLVRERRARLGAAGLVWGLSEETPFIGGAVFAELRGNSLATGFHPAFRFAGQLAHSPDVGGDIRAWLAAFRFEGCPLLVQGGPWQLRPCTGLDAGFVQATGAAAGDASDRGWWLAWAAQVRLGWEPTPIWGLELQGGLLLPLTRYDLTGGKPERTLSSLRSAGIGAGLGGHWGLP
jgi:hypothetical protein